MRYRSVVLPLLIVNIVVFLAQIVLGEGFTGMFMLISKDVLFRPWILVTSMFLHGGIDHIFYNMYGLFMFGQLLEHRIGPKWFFALYFSSGIIAAILSSFFYSAALGASAAIMGIIGALIILMPELRLLFFFVLPMPLWAAGIIWVLIDVFGIFFPTGVGNIAHLVGLFIGLMFGLFLKNYRSPRKKVVRGFNISVDDIEDYMRTGRI